WRRHGHSTRLPASAELPQPAPAGGQRQALLPGDDRRLRHHVLLRRPGRAGRPLGHRRLHPRLAAQPARPGGSAARRGGAIGGAMNSLATDPSRLGRLGLYVGGAALLGFIIVAWFGPRYALQSWLAAT